MDYWWLSLILLLGIPTSHPQPVYLNSDQIPEFSDEWLSAIKQDYCSTSQNINGCNLGLAPYLAKPHSTWSFDTDTLRANVYLHGELVAANETYKNLSVKLAQKWDYDMLIILMHGLASTPETVDAIRVSLEKKIKRKYLIITPNYNYYVQDKTHYLWYIHKTREHTELILKHLIEPTFITPDNIYLIGHSLGGQTVGVLGATIAERYGKPPRLTIGLDVCGPVYTLLPPRQRFNHGSGQQTIAIHTSPILGISYKFANVSIFVNDIYHKYGECPEGVDLILGCNHGLAVDLFSDIIENDYVVLNSDETMFDERISFKNLAPMFGHTAYNIYPKRGYLNNTYRPRFVRNPQPHISTLSMH